MPVLTKRLGPLAKSFKGLVMHDGEIAAVAAAVIGFEEGEDSDIPAFPRGSLEPPLFRKRPP